jgi:DNA/RNA endonuclease YhcR with UshA esterase domain
VAAISLYGDRPQLVPASVADILPLGQAVPIAAEIQIGQLTTADVGRLTVVRGTVAKVDAFSSGVKVTLDDGSGTVVALLWQSVYDALPGEAALDVGAEVEVQGEVSQYRGKLELIPELAQDVRVLAAAPLSAETKIGAMTAADVGRVVTVRGTLGPAAVFSKGVKFPLDDGTGTIILLLWQNVYDDIPNADRLVTGARVEVVGRIDEFRGTLEIIPEADGVRAVLK